MPSPYSNSRELLDFINNNNLSLETFLFSGNAVSLPSQATDLTPEELRHEQCHVEIWAWLGVSTTFHRDSGGFPFTVPNYEELRSYIRESGMIKKQFLDFYSLVTSAPRDLHGIELQGTDLRDYKILSREITTREELALYEAVR